MPVPLSKEKYSDALEAWSGLYDKSGDLEILDQMRTLEQHFERD